MQSTLTNNLLEQYLGKSAETFTVNDIVKYMMDNDIKLLNFRYIGEDGKLKTLNFAPYNEQHLRDILTFGERVDGSSLFSHINHASSDLYVIPRYRTAFTNPFTEMPTLDIMCSFFTPEGLPLESAPENILKKAYNIFKEKTGFEFKALGELEYYIQSPNPEVYPDNDQRGYHSSSPFSKWGHVRQEVLDLLSMCGAKVKYGHSEVGSFTTEEYLYEQHEIEFLPEEPEKAIEHLILAKWFLREICYREGVTVSWAPKISEGKAGSGLHFHMLLEKEGQNIMLENNELSDDAKKIIAGILDLADALTAFGNTVPTSYLRLVPGQEAPTYICWGYRNRSALVRVPLGWTENAEKMIKIANPQDITTIDNIGKCKQTVEFRVPDGSADLYLLMAGLITAATHGLNMDNALDIAEKTYAYTNIFSDEFKSKLEELPANCFESAIRLEKKRLFFEKDNIFPADLIENTCKRLKDFEDKNLSEKLLGNDKEIKKLVDKHMHCM